MFGFDGHLTDFGGATTEYNGRQHCSNNSRHFSVSSLLKLEQKRQNNNNIRRNGGGCGGGGGSDIDSNDGKYNKNYEKKIFITIKLSHLVAQQQQIIKQD